MNRFLKLKAHNRHITGGGKPIKKMMYGVYLCTAGILSCGKLSRMRNSSPKDPDFN